VALAVLLIRDVVGATESRLLAEARRQCEAACRELVRQHQERVAWGNDRLATQPLEVQDLPLRGVAATVLRSYPGLHLAERRLQPLRPLIEQAVGIVAEQARRKGVQIKVQLGPGEIWADVDGPQIIQVLINLLLNAIEASPPGGDVEVRARASEEGALIGVTDYGAGIPEPVRPHIFDAFFTTRPEGSGLGLSVSREIAVAHGGELEYDPAGPGTTFRLVLPGSGKPS